MSVFRVIATTWLILSLGGVAIAQTPNHVPIRAPYYVAISLVESDLKLHVKSINQVKLVTVQTKEGKTTSLKQTKRSHWKGTMSHSENLILSLTIGRFRVLKTNIKVPSTDKFSDTIVYRLGIDTESQVLHAVMADGFEQRFEQAFSESAYQKFLKTRERLAAVMKTKTEDSSGAWGWLLQSGYDDKHTHQAEVEHVQITGNELKSLSKPGFRVTDVWEWRTTGQTKIADMQYMSIIKTSATNQPLVGENDVSLQRLYARFRGQKAFIQIGDLSQRYSPNSVGGNFIGADFSYDIGAGVSVHTMAGFGERKWDWLYDKSRPSQYRQNVSSARLQKSFGRRGEAALSWAKASDVATSLETTTLAPIQTTLTGLDFKFKRLFGNTVTLTGEAYRGKVNLDTVSSDTFKNTLAMSFKLRYRPSVHQFTGFFSRIDPDYQSIGRSANQDRQEWWVQYQTRLWNKRIRLDSRYKTYHDNLDSSLDKTTTNTNPRTRVDIRPFDQLPNFRVIGTWDNRKRSSNDLPKTVDLSTDQKSVELSYKYAVFNLGGGYSLFSETDSVSSNANEDHQILKASIKGSQSNWNPAPFGQALYVRDNESISDELETSLDLKGGIVLSMGKLIQIRPEYRRLNRERTSTGTDTTKSVTIPIRVQMNAEGTRFITFKYQKDDYTFTDTTLNYADRKLLGQVTWEL